MANLSKKAGKQLKKIRKAGSNTGMSAIKRGKVTHKRLKKRY